MESIENSEEISFRYRIGKYRRITVPSIYKELEEGDIYQVTLKKLKNNHIPKDYEENNSGLEN